MAMGSPARGTEIGVGAMLESAAGFDEDVEGWIGFLDICLFNSCGVTRSTVGKASGGFGGPEVRGFFGAGFFAGGKLVTPVMVLAGWVKNFAST